jgi:hypothetical protein
MFRKHVLSNFIILLDELLTCDSHSSHLPFNDVYSFHCTEYQFRSLLNGSVHHLVGQFEWSHLCCSSTCTFRDDSTIHSDIAIEFRDNEYRSISCTIQRHFAQLIYVFTVILFCSRKFFTCVHFLPLSNMELVTCLSSHIASAFPFKFPSTDSVFT